MKSPFRVVLPWCAFLIFLPFLLDSCGSSNYSGGSGNQTQTFTIGGTVSNLAGTGLMLQNNGGNTLSVGANGTFTFTTSVAANGAYDVTVSTPPSSPAQTCSVANGSGNASANVTNITVNCGHNEWAWINGSNASSTGTALNGNYPPTPGTAAATNLPGVRNFGPTSWMDSNGNFWLFGGNGNDSAGTDGDLNDLWKYNLSSGEWTWVSGSNLANQSGSYGIENTPATTNVPGARDSAIGWIDTSGDLWLFGGEFTIATGPMTGTIVYYNDLWKYSISNNEWTWVAGSSSTNENGSYGTKGSATGSNIPGARAFSTAQFISGDVWVFGGYGFDSAATTPNNLNDLWKFDGTNWTWVDGSSTANGTATYGTKGTSGSTNIPGARYYASTWTDTSGNFWLFGGSNLEVDGVTVDYFNDLWEYSIVSNAWTWMNGTNTLNQNGAYGTQGTAAAANTPGSRGDAFRWSDPSGNFWLFGGFGNDSVAPQVDLNDLWEYSPSANQWTYKNGPVPYLGNGNGMYGTIGKLAPGNIPGNREGGAYWADASGDLWLFGGSGTNAINDLWMYFP